MDLKALEDLLVSSFSVGELHRFLTHYLGRQVSGLPEPTGISPKAYAFEVVRFLAQRNLLDQGFAQALATERSGRREEIFALFEASSSGGPSPANKAGWASKWIAVVLIAVASLGGLTFVLWPDPPNENSRRMRHYYQAFDLSGLESGDMVDDLWHIGIAEGAWDGSVAAGSYRLCNASDETRVYRNRLDTFDDDGEVPMGDARMTMRVGVEPPNTTNSGVGILFRSSTSGDRFLAFLANAGPLVTLLRYEAGKLEVLWSNEFPNEANLRHLAVEGDGPRVRLYVDDELAHTEDRFRHQDGDVGVFAYSTGCFVIDEIAVFGEARMQ